MKTILFLSYDLPYPLDAGGKIRSYHLIRQLSRKYKIRLAYFYRKEINISDEKRLLPFCEKIIAFQRRSKSSLSTMRYIHKLPYPAALYYEPNIEKRIEKEIKDGIDAIHYESFYTSVYMKDSVAVPQILGTENIEWHVYSDYLKHSTNPLKRSLLRFEISRIRYFEQQSWYKPDLALAVSEANQKQIESYSSCNVALVKNGVDTEFFSKVSPNQTSRDILFVGNFNYIQNKDALDYLLKNIVPRLNNDFSLRIVGRDPTSDIRKLVEKTSKKTKIEISLERSLADIRDAYKSAFILIAPIRAGSGTKFKTLEAMACGLPVVSTSIGAEGIDAEHGKHILISDTSEGLVKQIQTLSHNTKLYEKISKNSKQLITKKYSWDIIGDKLLKEYEKIINNNRKL